MSSTIDEVPGKPGVFKVRGSSEVENDPIMLLLRQAERENMISKNWRIYPTIEIKLESEKEAVELRNLVNYALAIAEEIRKDFILRDKTNTVDVSSIPRYSLLYLREKIDYIVNRLGI